MPPDPGPRERTCLLIDAELPYLLELYRHLHRNPELSGMEEKTAATLARELESVGVEVISNLGGHGVAGILRNGTGPVVLVRADMDALPIEEETGLPYASVVRTTDSTGAPVGVMHACGHDIHMAVLVGIARIFSRMRDRWGGTLVFVGQPSEEMVSGAKKMVDEGLYTRVPHPDAALALHVGPDLPPGVIGYREGIFSAGADSIDIEVRGIGGHAAHPDQTRDPVVISATMILAFQTIITREIPPNEFAILTVASVHGGTKHNAIPDQVDLQANIRYFKPEIRELLLEAIRRVANGVALAAGVPADRMPVVRVETESVLPLVNDPGLSERIALAFIRNLGKDRVKKIEPLSGSEDFGFFGMVRPPVPLCYFRIGTGSSPVEGQGQAYLHSSRFAPDPGPAIVSGLEAMCIALLELTGIPDQQTSEP
ncbi:hippurate hydrolase [Methanolinea mesophila]|uniref:M20 metallopeptidase family protein n=1 Tax=Methanolinea mesophila TaxID=547055 RepID=UPI001AE9C36C|nr:amidohydrolase [Methanolinea mesophila]MBP1927948.1 hippurate hydrolase [Methanolinea mesophila]